MSSYNTARFITPGSTGLNQGFNLLGVRIAKALFAPAALTLLLLIAGGCATMDRAYEGTVGMTNPDKTRLQEGLRWQNPLPQLRPPAAQQRLVYLRVRNVSGVDVDGLEANVRSVIMNSGYDLTRNPDEAAFTLQIDIRHFGENREKDGGASVLTGGAIGGITGAVVGHNVGSGHAGTGAVAGAVLGAAAGNVLANRNKMVEYNLIVDVRFGERLNQAVQTTRTTGSQANTAQQITTRLPGSHVESGSSSSSSADAQQVKLEESFLYHNNRVVAHATRMNLSANEALPALQQRLARALGNVLP